MVYVVKVFRERVRQPKKAKITKNIRMLSDFPEAGALLSSIVNMDTDYRFIVCGNYTAFYRFEENTVYIVRVLYGRRDFMRILFDTPAVKEDKTE